MITTHKAYDEAWGKETIIIEDSYVYRILGQDNELHVIDSCWANYYIMLQLEREGKI